LTEATSLCKMIDKGKMDERHPDAHIVVPLMGRLKGRETGEHNVLVLLSSVTTTIKLFGVGQRDCFLC